MGAGREEHDRDKRRQMEKSSSSVSPFDLTDTIDVLAILKWDCTSSDNCRSGRMLISSRGKRFPTHSPLLNFSAAMAPWPITCHSLLSRVPEHRSSGNYEQEVFIRKRHAIQFQRNCVCPVCRQFQTQELEEKAPDDKQNINMHSDHVQRMQL